MVHFIFSDSRTQASQEKTHLPESVGDGGGGRQRCPSDSLINTTAAESQLQKPSQAKAEESKKAKKAKKV